jgi:translation initiation factor IF-2
MQQRQLRLGDILDDYCPRERRITNHAVVAMVGPEVKQTRCSTCDAEHEYKQAKVPVTRKKKTTAHADEPAAAIVVAPPRTEPAGDGRETETAPAVLAPADRGRPRQREQVVAPAVVDAPSASEELAPPLPPAPAQPSVSPAAPPAEPTPVAAAPDADTTEPSSTEDEGPVHRRLIRATLPRPEGQVVRPTPQFTMRQPIGRPAGFGGGKGRGPRSHGGPGSGRGPVAGHAKGGRTFVRGGSNQGDAFGRTRGRDQQPQQRNTRHSSPGHPPRSGKKHSK